VIDINFICKFSASIGGAINKGVVFNSTNTMNLGMIYSNSQWQPIYGFNNANTVSLTATNGNVKATINLAIIPTISFKILGIWGPYVSIGLQEQLIGTLGSPSLDWDFSAGAWLQTTLGAHGIDFSLPDTTLRSKLRSILGAIPDFNPLIWNTDTLFYKTPVSILKISGDDQTGPSNQNLPLPLKTQVLDSKGSSQSNVPVYFTITAGGGSVQDSSTLTDSNGYAQTFWKLGSQFGVQTLDVSAKKADGTLLQNAPIEFAAATDSSLALTTTNVSAITQTTAVSGGNIINDGGFPVTARGVCWSNATNPTTANSKTTDGSGTGSFTSTISGLTQGQTYYVRAYATNSAGTAYGSEVSFKTLANTNILWGTVWIGTFDYPPTTECGSPNDNLTLEMYFDNVAYADSIVAASWVFPQGSGGEIYLGGSTNKDGTELMWHDGGPGFTFTSPWSITGNNMDGTLEYYIDGATNPNCRDITVHLVKN
jgi:hypothetical protein